MLPKDMTNIINEYNEIGIFIRCNRRLYWFNGKRFEFWCEATNKYCFMTYNNDLYWNFFGKVSIYKNKQFITSQVPKIWNHPLYVFQQGLTLINGKVYDYDINLQVNMITDEFNNRSILPEKHHPDFGFKLIYYKDSIYYFGSIQNEKFINGNWIVIAQYPNIYNDYDVYLFNDKFYAFELNTTYYHIYNPELDCWEQIAQK